jgi:hypothetical protein
MRLAYEDTDKRIYVTQEATDDDPQVEHVEWVNPNAPEARLAEVEARIEAVAALADKANATAQEVAQAARDGLPPKR